MMFDFCYWREQLCIIGCPYGRFQSVMLDKSSLVVGYDQRRGESRGRGRDREAKGLGDCVDCKMCVDVCPTGIDIRDGLQLECVNCTQCIDACDAVMDRVGQPKGLIRYSSQSAMEGAPTPIIRPRVMIYVGIITVIAGVFLTLLATRNAFDVTLLRGLGRPFVVLDNGEVENLIRMKIVNRTEEERSYRVEVTHPPDAHLAEELSFTLATAKTTTEPIRVIAPAGAFATRGGTLEITLLVTDSEGATVQRNYRLFGPSSAAKPKEPQADTSRQEN
jgi:cytochrome c oxidase accessory protein FixG